MAIDYAGMFVDMRKLMPWAWGTVRSCELDIKRDVLREHRREQGWKEGKGVQGDVTTEKEKGGERKEKKERTENQKRVNNKKGMKGR